MQGDEIGSKVRERLWLTKWDHNGPEPLPVERVFIENGQEVERRPLTTTEAAEARAERAASLQAAAAPLVADDRSEALRKRWE